MSTVTISTKRPAPMSLTVKGSPRVRGANFTTLSSFYSDVDGVKKKFFFLDEHGNESPLNINPTIQLDLKNKIQKHNYDTLLIYIKHFPQVSNIVSVIDPEKDSKEFIELEEKQTEAKAYIMRLNKDKDFSSISDIVRVKTLSVLGKTNVQLYGEALKLAQSEPEFILSFKKKDGNKYKVMASKAIESGVLLVESVTGYIRYTANREMVEETMEKFEFRLQNDNRFRTDIESAIEAHLQRVNSQKVEDKTDEIESLLNVGIDLETIVSTESDVVDIESVKPIISAAITAEAFQVVDGKYKIPTIASQPMTLDELNAYYSANPKEFEILKTELINAGLIFKE